MPNQPIWASSSPDWTIRQTEVHVWLANLTRLSGNIQQLSSLLSEDERERAKCFSFEQDRQRFIFAHWLLRALLGKYLDLEPGMLQFVSGPSGKPQLALHPGNISLRFNMSCSHEFALYALSWGREVGVDIEYMRPIEDADAIARHFFSPREQAALLNLPPEMKRQAFFNCWTRKEAYIKATGEGLSRPLDQFAVSCMPGTPAQLLYVQDKPEEIRRWSLQSVHPPAGYAAAVVAEGSDWRIVYWEWS